MGDDELGDYLKRGGRVTAPESASPRYRAEVLRLMAIFVDSEMAGASGFADCINLAPGLSERRIAARIVFEKFGHAAMVLALMEGFGADIRHYVGAHPWKARLDRSVDLGTRRAGGDMRLNVFHAPIQGWVDAVVMNVLMGRATAVQLDDWTRSSYQPLAGAAQKILPTEIRHAEYGENGLTALLASGHDPTDAQASVNYWYPRVADTFGSAASKSIDTFRALGLRQRSNQDLVQAWRVALAPLLLHWKLTAPEGR